MLRMFLWCRRWGAGCAVVSAGTEWRMHVCRQECMNHDVHHVPPGAVSHGGAHLTLAGRSASTPRPAGGQRLMVLSSGPARIITLTRSARQPKTGRTSSCRSTSTRRVTAWLRSTCSALSTATSPSPTSRTTAWAMRASPGTRSCTALLASSFPLDALARYACLRACLRCAVLCWCLLRA